MCDMLTLLAGDVPACARGAKRRGFSSARARRC